MSKIAEIIAAQKGGSQKVADIKSVAQKPRFGRRPRIAQAPDMERIQEELEEVQAVAADVRDFRKEVSDEMAKLVKGRMEIQRMIEAGADRDEEEIFSVGLDPQLKEVEKDLKEALGATFPYREPVLVAFGAAAVAASEDEQELEWAIRTLTERGFLDAVDSKDQAGNHKGFFRFRGRGYNLGREFNGSPEAVEVVSGFRTLADRFHKEAIAGFLKRVAELKKKAGPNPVFPNEIGERVGLGFVYVPNEEAADGRRLPGGWLLFEIADGRLRPTDCEGKFDRLVNEMIETSVSISVGDIGKEKLSEYIPSKDRFRLTFVFLKMISRGVAAFAEFEAKGYYGD